MNQTCAASEYKCLAVNENISSAMGRQDKELVAFQVSYCQGAYNEADGFRNLLVTIQDMEKASKAKTWGRLFYLALPPSVYLDVLTNVRYHVTDFASTAEGSACGSETWLRVIVEKPFGRDLASSEDLAEKVSKLFTEQQVYRIDHFLGKELTQACFQLALSCNTAGFPMFTTVYTQLLCNASWVVSNQIRRLIRTVCGCRTCW